MGILARVLVGQLWEGLQFSHFAKWQVAALSACQTGTHAYMGSTEMSNVVAHAALLLHGSFSLLL